MPKAWTKKPTQKNQDETVVRRPSFQEMMEYLRDQIVEKRHREEIMVALICCRSSRQMLPDWLYDSLEELIDDYFGVGRPGPVKNSLQRVHWDAIDSLRYTAVRMARERFKVSWVEAYGIAVDILSDTAAAGGEDSMKASYQKFHRNR